MHEGSEIHGLSFLAAGNHAPEQLDGERVLA